MMMGPEILGVVMVGALALALPVAVIWLLFKVLQGLFWVLGRVFGGLGRGIGAGARGTTSLARHTGRFVRDEVGDVLRLVGGLVTTVVYVPLVLLNVCLGRWSTANHFGRELEGELKGSALALYRAGVGNPARFLGFGKLTEGLERRVPEALARAPRGDRPGGLRTFDGYRVVDTLPRGGSGAWLFLAEASPEKQDLFARAGLPRHERVVLKSFSLDEGSTLPQILRENKAMELARDMGLVLDHELTSERFFYAMPYVEGADLGHVTTDMHARSGERGLDLVGLREAAAVAADVLETLDRFHARGLWHKDIKPSNVIVAKGEGEARRAHLVDLGLVTPLASAMTLTTHGTEYFRDPEMVRLAMQGVKVQDVDGVRFDLYSVGALLYSMLENSFPAHGSLSQVTKDCPDTLRWIVRRAMAEMGQRYRSAREMLADLRVVLVAPDPYALTPASLPSMGGAEADDVELAGARPMDDEGRPAPGQPLAPSFGVPGSDPELDEAAAIAAARTRKKKARVRTGVMVAAALLFFFVVAPVAALLVGVAAYADSGSGSSPFAYSLDEHSAHGPSYGQQLELRVQGEAAPHAPPAPAVPGLRVFSPGDYPAAQRYWDPQEFQDLAGSLGEVLSTGADEWMDWLERQARLLEQPVGRGEPIGRVLVIDDLREPNGRGKVGELLTTLDRARFELLTDDHVTGDDAFDARVIDLLAGARSSVGLSDPASRDAAVSLRAFLAEEAGGDADYVLWLDDDPTGIGVRYRIVAPGADTGLRIAPVR